MQRSGATFLRQLQKKRHEALLSAGGAFLGLRFATDHVKGDLGVISGAPEEAYQRKVGTASLLLYNPLDSDLIVPQDQFFWECTS